jgi:outer membrane scaffolding protein for murein synthesis (MipA/OmpV family)
MMPPIATACSRGLARMALRLFGAMLMTIALASPALCQGTFYTTHESSDWDVSLGVAGGMRPTFPGSDRYRAIGLPIFLIRYNDMVSLADDGLSVYWHTGNLRIGTAFTYEGGRLDHESDGIFNSGDNRLKGLGDVDSSLGIRGFVSYQFDSIYADISATKYIGPDDKGVLVSAGLSSPITIGSWIFRPYGRVTWADDNYMQTLFGVTPLQASRSIFPQFNASSGVEDASGGMTIVYRVNRHWFLGVDANATQYLSSAADSPITISNTNLQVTAGIGYHF